MLLIFGLFLIVGNVITDLKVIEIEQPEEMNVYGAGLKAAIKLNEINEES